MTREIGSVRQLFRYPVKSMAAVAIEGSALGWHGLPGDRRFAFRKTAARNGFPWLQASRLPELIVYQPFGQSDADPLRPTHVRTPAGLELELTSDALRAELSAKLGEDVEVMHLDRGIFDLAPVSVICEATIREIERESGFPLDVRRFRPNVLVETPGGEPFQEDAWVGRTLIFGDPSDGPAVTVTLRDERCVMVNLDPDTAERDARVMKVTARRPGNCAGVYATVVREGRISVGQAVHVRER